MSLRKCFKIAINVGMFLLFLLLMGAHLTSSTIHEWLGIGLFLCFSVHNILHFRWYKALFKRKYTVLRSAQTMVNLLLLLTVIGCIISALMISGVVFSDIRLPGIEPGRKLHMLCTAWSFILMSIHLGLHIRPFKTSKNIQYILYVIALTISVYGIFIFADRKLWEELFLLTEYKWFDYDKNVIVYSLETLAMSVSFTILTRMIKRFDLYLKEKRHAKKH